MNNSLRPPTLESVPLPLIDALFRPPTRSQLDTAAFVAAERACEAAAHVLDTAVVLDSHPLERSTSAHATEFGLHFRSAEEFTLSFDLAACRALVDALHHAHAGLRGVGPLTPTEIGALEYFVLACLDQLTQIAPESATLALVGVEAGPELRRRLTQAEFVAFELTLQVGRALGSAALWLPAANASELSAFARRAPVRSSRLDVGCAIELEGLSEEQLSVLTPGDVVMLGRTTVVGAPVRLIASCGWELAPAAVEFDSPTVLRVRRGALAARAVGWNRPTVTALVEIGHAALDRTDIAHWSQPGMLDLAKTGSAPARLVLRDGLEIPGELVHVAGELGLRVLAEMPNRA